MTERRYENWIGMMDSGVGGISVLRRAVDLLPNENFIYYGDSANAPYGDKDPEWICQRTSEIVSNLINEGVKAVVIACNTATSAAADYVRAEHPEIPIIGLEPALKQAAQFPEARHVLVMATPVTIHLQKYQDLYDKWGKRVDASSVVCGGLADRIEKGNLDAPDMHELLESLIGEYRGKADSVVLGCTHFPLLAHEISSALGPDVRTVSSAEETAREVAEILGRRGELADPASPNLGAGGEPKYRFATTSDDITSFAVAGKFIFGHSLDSIEHIELDTLESLVD